jgi:S-formylglutathione hydrolase FrmB
MPKDVRPAEKLPVVYVLHGGGGDFREWTNYSNVAKFAERHVLVVMPDGNSSYYVNSATMPEDRYEDYIVKDLVSDVEARFPVATDRSHRAIAGISMGGFGAVKLALSHPDLFVMVAGMSSAIDVPRRPFSIKRISQWRHHSSIFGPWGSATRREKDPFVLAESADPGKTPFFYLTCGEQERLMPANRQFVALLDRKRIPHVFVPGPGGHDWNQWNRVLPEAFDSFFRHLGMN